MTDSSMVPAQDSDELRQLTARYAHFADAGRVDELVLLFTADAVWDGRPAGQPLREGLGAIREGFGAPRTAGARFLHLTGNHIVTRFDGGSADGSEYSMAVSTGNDTEMLFVLSRLDDEYVKTPDGWRFRKRTLVNLTRARLALIPKPS